MAKEKTNWFTVIMLWFAGIAAAMQFAKFSFAFDFLKNQYNVSYLWIGLSLSIVGLIGLIFGITISIYISKIGQNKILFISLFFGFIVSLVQALKPGFPVMFISRIIVMGLWSSFFGIAFSVTAWAGKPIVELYFVSGLFLIHAIFLFLIFIILFFSINKLNIPRNESNKISFLAAHIKVYSNWRTVSPGILFFFHTFMYIALFTFLPGLSENKNTKSLLLVILPLISIIGTMIAGIISQYFVSPSKLIVTAYTSLIIIIFAIKMSFNNNVMFIISSIILILFSGIIAE